MQEPYVISCCSTADLSAEHFDEIGVRYIYFHYELDGKQYPDDLGKSMNFEDFYRAMANGADTHTSQINAEEFVEYFTPMLEAGQDIVHVSLSSGISGVYNSARLAAEELREKFPERKIYVIDSLAASSGYGLLMDKMAELRAGGMSLEELVDWTEKNKKRVHHWFFSSDLTFFIKGGRISKTAGAFGTMLNICPLMNVDFEGRLIPRSKVRTKKKVIQEIVKRMEEHAENGHDYSGKVYLSQSACVEDAKAVATLIQEKFPKMTSAPEINYIGTTIGSHTGPGTVALFFWGDERID